jgi:hypothetical protein
MPVINDGTGILGVEFHLEVHYFSASTDMKVEKFVLPGILLVVLGISLLIFLNSRWGIGVTHDSIFYLSSAGNLVKNNGLQWSASDGSLHPLTHFPPLYPLLLASVMAFRIPAVQAATGLSAILLGLNIFTAGFLIYHFTQSKIASIFVSLSLAISSVFINLHLIALSEPLFIWLVMASIGFLGFYFEKPSPKLLLLTGILAGLSLMTRYVGISVIATGVVAIALLEKSAFRIRIVNIFLYLFVSLFPFLIWIAQNAIMVGSTTNRSFIYHSLEWGNRKLGFETISGWFTGSPVAYKSTIAISGLFLCALLIWWLWLGWKLVFLRSTVLKNPSALRVVFAFNSFSLIYLAGILFSLMFFDASTRLDNRILGPVYISFVCALFVTLGRLSLRWQWSGGIIFALLLVLNLPVTTASLTDFLEQGMGFSSKSWEESPAVEYVRAAGAGNVIYSNQGMALHFLTDIPIHDVPEKMDVVRNMVRDDYPARMEKMTDDLSKPGSFVIWFTGGGLSDSILDETGIDLQVYREYPDAAILATSENVKNGSLP